MDGMNGGYGDSGLREEAVGRHDERAEDVSRVSIFFSLRCLGHQTTFICHG